MSAPADVTGLLRELSSGSRDALDRLIPIVFDELRRIAHRQLQSERADHTLNTTALVHEAYLKLIDVKQIEWSDRTHFFAMSARVMRRVLIDYARARKRNKRGGGAITVSLDDAMGIAVAQLDDLIALEDALSRLEAKNERQCKVVECRCFVGLSVEETAEALKTSPATVKRDWAFSRAWLNRELAAEHTGTS